MEQENKKYNLVEEELKNVDSAAPNSNDSGTSEDSSEVSPESDYNMSETSQDVTNSNQNNNINSNHSNLLMQSFSWQ